ncbi:hypothetical protein YC2023_051545 [Brassica napus]
MRAYGVDMLFLDEKGSVNAHRLNTFRHLFSEGSLYSISGFEVTSSNNNFELSNSPLAIRCAKWLMESWTVPRKIFQERCEVTLCSIRPMNNQEDAQQTLKKIQHQFKASSFQIGLKRFVSKHLLQIHASTTLTRESSKVVSNENLDGLEYSCCKTSSN